ncbi:MAG: DNA polymerase III subunit gamma/tau [Lentihominibacter sp.]
MYQALYRAYRPEVFDEVLGQEHIVRIIKNQLATDSTSHAYLFCGTRGTGKTTTARLLAKGLNCLSDGEKPCGECDNCMSIKEGSFIDVIEIDAASNNGVDNIRELRESVNYPPAVGRNKIYIIDEVHMLSTGAFNALLKTLEEPPEYVTFILATTEVQKLPATILSRCMRLDFKRVPEKTIIAGMARICSEIGIEATEDALRIIAANADGSVRDGLSILDQCISGGEKKITEREVLEFLGASGDEDFIRLTDMVRHRKTAEAIAFLAEVLSDGKDVRQFMRDWINHYRNLLMARYIRNPQNILNMSAENIERISAQSSSMEPEEINKGIMELSHMLNEARWSTQPRILLELSIVKLCQGEGAPDDPATPPEPPAMPRSTSNIEPAALREEPEEANPKEPEEANPKEPEEENSPEESEEESPPKASEEESLSEHEEEILQEDLEKIWQAVYEDGEAAMGSFNIISCGGTLTSVDEHSFTVVVGNNVVKEHVENNRNLIEDLMEKHTGKRRALRISQKTLSGGRKKTAEEIAETAGDVLGIQISIE